jgi:hypothetical protein
VLLSLSLPLSLSLSLCVCVCNTHTHAGSSISFPEAVTVSCVFFRVAYSCLSTYLFTCPAVSSV